MWSILRKLTDKENLRVLEPSSGTGRFVVYGSGYFKGKFIASNLCVILTPKENVTVELKFYAKYLNAIRPQVVEDLADETSKLTIDIEELKTV